MDNKKFEQLMDMIINENTEQARELFHEIVVEKSREIYESIMEEEMMDDGMGGQVGDLIDEISYEEEGVSEDDGEFDSEEDMDVDSDDDIDFEEFGAEESDDIDSGDELEDSVVRIEDKLDQLMTEFESLMSGDMEDADIDDEEVDVDTDFEDTDDEEFDFDSEEESDEEVMEAVQLQKVSVTHGDNGSNTKSPVAANAGKTGSSSKPVNSSTTTENGRTAPTSKDVKGAGSFKNAPGQKKQDLSAAPKPVTKQASENSKSPVAK